MLDIDNKNGDEEIGKKQPARAIVVVPVLPLYATKGKSYHQPASRSANARLDEAVGLALAIDLVVPYREIVNLSKLRSATLLGKGKLEEIASHVKDYDCELVIFDHPLTPVQQRNLEETLNVKVLDRTGLILEIFGRRARTKEGVLQVELAHLQYQRGRLVRSWTHLERQRGGAGFLGGPGETQIEADRRMLQEKISRIKRELTTVQRTRELHRAKRRKVPFPIVAIVGYTNAGKSTLFNRLTGANVMAQDMLFATLDPTLRQVKLPNGATIILSDTVGFISDLPTHLIAAFRATLEEVIEADLVLHLRDISDPDCAAQGEDVEQILSDLGVDSDDKEHVLEVWNKIDLIENNEQDAPVFMEDQKLPIVISAFSGQGIDQLLNEVESKIAGVLEEIQVTLKADQLHLLDWIYSNMTVQNREDHGDGQVTLGLLVSNSTQQKLFHHLGQAL